jgi:translation initiation factor IF-2
VVPKVVGKTVAAAKALLTRARCKVGKITHVKSNTVAKGHVASSHPKAGTIAGSFVTEGKITRTAQIRLLRDNVVIFEGKIASLKRFKDDASEVARGYECGIGIHNYNDLKIGDSIEAFFMESVKATSAG